MKSKFDIIFEHVMSIINENDAGQGAIKDVVKIAKANIEPTIKSFEKEVFEPIGIPREAWTSEIGSTGKKDFSGDIDIALNYNSVRDSLNEDLTDKEINDRIKMQLDKAGYSYVTKNGINIRVPIKGSQEGEFVQIDIFKTSSLEFTKFAKFGPSPEESKYKGAIRSDLLSILVKTISLKAANEGLNDDDDKYIAPDGTEYPAKEFIQYSLCDDGLYKRKKSFIGKKGGILAKPRNVTEKEELISQAPQEMIDMLFGKGLYTTKDFNSFESIWHNVIFSEKFPYKDKIEQIAKRIYNVLVEKNRPIPDELNEFMEKGNAK